MGQNDPVKILAYELLNSGAGVGKEAFRTQDQQQDTHVRNFIMHVTQVHQTRLLRATTIKTNKLLAAFHADTNEAMLPLAAAKCIVAKIDYQRPMTFHHAPPANNQTAR